MVASLITYFFVGDFPDKATFLTPDEKNYVFATLRNDSGDASTERLTWEAFKNHSQDPFVWISTIMFMCIVVPTYGLAFFVPSILVVRMSVVINSGSGDEFLTLFCRVSGTVVCKQHYTRLPLTQQQ